MVFIVGEHAPTNTIGGTSLKKVKDFKYLGAKMQSTLKDIR